MTLQIKRGLTSDLPSTAADGEILFATDTNKLYVGNNGAPQEVTGGGGGTTGAFLVNEDGSKSVQVTLGTTTEWAGQSLWSNSARWNGTDISMWGTYANMLQIPEITNQAFASVLQSLVAGDTLTLYEADTRTTYVFTIVSSIYDTRDGNGYPGVSFVVEEINTVSPSGSAVYFGQIDGVNAVTVSTVVAIPATFYGSGMSTIDLVAHTGLIGNVSIIDNTISAVDDYGTAGTLIVEGDLTITGALNAATTLVVNDDGSKSVVVSSLSTTQYPNVSWMNASLPGSMDNPETAGKIMFSNVSQETRDILNNLVAGDKITLGNYNGMEVQYYTYTIETAGLVFDYMYMQDMLNIVETNPNSMSVSFNSYYGLTVEGSSFSYFDFSDEAFSATNVISESALLGEVAITGNTISAVDANGYGTGADLSIVSDLVLEGDLTVSGELGTPMNTSSPTAYTVVQHKDANGNVNSYYMPLYQ